MLATWPTGQLSENEPLHMHLMSLPTKAAENGQFHMENWQFFEFYESNYSALLSDIKLNEMASFSH